MHLGAGIGEKGGAVVGGWCVRSPADYPGAATLNPPRNIPQAGTVTDEASQGPEVAREPVPPRPPGRAYAPER